MIHKHFHYVFEVMLCMPFSIHPEHFPNSKVDKKTQTPLNAEPLINTQIIISSFLKPTKQQSNQNDDIRLFTIHFIGEMA